MLHVYSETFLTLPYIVNSCPHRLLIWTPVAVSYSRPYLHKQLDIKPVRSVNSCFILFSSYISLDPTRAPTVWFAPSSLLSAENRFLPLFVWLRRNYITVDSSSLMSYLVHPKVCTPSLQKSYNPCCCSSLAPQNFTLTMGHYFQPSDIWASSLLARFFILVLFFYCLFITLGWHLRDLPGWRDNLTTSVSNELKLSANFCSWTFNLVLSLVGSACLGYHWEHIQVVAALW